jgi:hypothetical protein
MVTTIVSPHSLLGMSDDSSPARSRDIPVGPDRLRAAPLQSTIERIPQTPLPF